MKLIIDTDVYIIADYEFNYTMNGLNTAKVTLTETAITTDTLCTITLDDESTVIFIGYIDKKEKIVENYYRYTILQRARELKNTRINVSGNYNVRITTATSIDDIIDNYVLPSTWSRANSDTSTLTNISFYYTDRITGVYKILQSYGGYNVWFDDSALTVGFGTNWHDLSSTNITNYIDKSDSEQSFDRNFDQVIVIGQSDSISGSYPTSGLPTDPTIKVFQYTGLTSNDEASVLAEQLYNQYGSQKIRITVTLPSTFDYNEADLVQVDGINYTVYDIKITRANTVLGLESGKTTIYDILGDKLTEVTGEISTGSDSSYDGGTENIGAPSVEYIVEPDTATNYFLVDSASTYYSNGDRVYISSTGNLPTTSPQVVINTTYYVINTSTTGFQISTTSGGSAITISSDGTGVIRIRNLDSASVPATFNINVKDINVIENFVVESDFDAYTADGVGAEVNFLSAVDIISNNGTATAGSSVYSGSHYYPTSSGVSCTLIEDGFQHGKSTIGLTMQNDYTTTVTGTVTFQCQVNYHGDGWVNEGSSLIYYFDTPRTEYVTELSGYLDVIRHNSSMSHSVMFSGDDRPETSDGTVLVRWLVTTSWSAGSYLILKRGGVTVDRVPRHKHVIDRDYNPVANLYARTTTMTITNSTYTNEVIATWTVGAGDSGLSGTVIPDGETSSEIDITSYLRDGINKITYFSDNVGAVCLTGTYQSYKS